MTRTDVDMSDTRRGEILLGFNVRAGLWIDGLEILTSLGRRSGIYGNATGGSGSVSNHALTILLIAYPTRSGTL